MALAVTPHFSRRIDQHAWDLLLDDCYVVRCLVDYAFSIEFSNGVEIRIGGQCVRRLADGTMTTYDPGGDPALLGPLLPIARLEATSGYAFTDGHLELAFSDQSTVTVPVDESYEAWDLTGPRGFKLVSLPGGGLAEWSQVESQ